MSSRISGQAIAQSYVELHKVRAVQFGFLNSEEILKMSVASIENERVYDDRGLPNFNGINDPRMGTMDKELRCFTCKGTQADCPGHFGHIELAKPVFHAGLIEHIRKVLKCVCYNCHHILASKEEIDKIKSIKSGKFRLTKALDVCTKTKTCDQTTGGCGRKQPKYTKSGLQIIQEITDIQDLRGQDSQRPLMPIEALQILKGISDEDCDTLGFNHQISRPENMIIQNLAVPPPPVRPSVTNTVRSEDDLTYSYQKVLQINNQLKSQIQKGAQATTINDIVKSLQYYVATVMDNEIQGQPTHKHKSGKPLKAIRARLKGKEGRLRGNLMGKRVDFSARTVITPDPILQLDQLGVPLQIALNLTIPETVTSENIDEMRQLVNNGPHTWPGAKYIIRYDDRQIDLSQMRNRSDAHLEPGYKVERHLRNDDYVIFNRQPSLHKMSLMGHRVKVLPFSTFRLNLSVTTPYNADFDGDEMNMHVPQSFETTAEIKEIMAVPNQIVSPQSNKPVMGIVQDSLLGVMLFTQKDTFLEKDVVMSLLMWINYEENTFPMPCILKPKPLWSGKQIFSLVIPDINLQRYSDSVSDNWASHNKDDSKKIFIKKGQLLVGNITKGVIGNSSGGMVHIIWKEKGPYPCRDFLSNTQLLINNWLYQNGFTVGVQDIIARKETTQIIKEKMILYQQKFVEILEQAQTGKLKQQPGKSMMESFEASVNTALNEARNESGKIALEDLFSWNRLKSMVYAGSKGSDLNISQIMACVGQQNVEGKRIPFGFHKRTLPHFSKDDFGPESKGFVENCYLSGLTPQEFYFHAMGGREGLIDTAVKTAETGYIQRRLMKALEDVMVKYDGTVRNSKEQVVQFLYGEDGMSGENIEDLKIDLLNMNDAKLEEKMRFIPPQLNTLQREQMLLKSISRETVDSFNNDPQSTLKLEKEFQQIIQDRDDLRTKILKCSDDSVHLAVNVPRIIWNAKEQFNIRQNSTTDLSPMYVLDRLNSLFGDLSAIPGVSNRQHFLNNVAVRNDPLILEANENSTWLFKIYVRSLLNTKTLIQTERFTQNAFDWMIGEIKSRFEQSIVHPGENVGSIGAQSMGEPATQMTLNTFHFAGVSAKNVTLGVPRLKEIINVAKNIKTPSMKIYLKEELRKIHKMATTIGGKIEHTTLAHVVSNSSIFYDPDPQRTIVKSDVDLVDLYNMTSFDTGAPRNFSPWVLRLELNYDIMQFKDLSMKMISDIFDQNFGEMVNIIASDENADSYILRIRLNEEITDSEEETACMYLKEFQDQIYNDLALKGIHEITKVTFTKYEESKFYPQNVEPIKRRLNESINSIAADIARINSDQRTLQREADKIKELEESLKKTKKQLELCKPGAEYKDQDNWMIETDGVALQKVAQYEEIDYNKTVSNDIIEILNVLGIEAVRLSLINELRFVLNSYGIYVNYRHLSTLCDVMTQRGIITSITRHGINRVDSGALRKCSFEETVEILLDAAVYSELDPLKGITENLIMGQLGPFGTGCFDLVVDRECIERNAIAKPEDENIYGGNTPMGGDEEPDIMIGTPIQQYTPMPNYPGSEYSQGATPGYQGGFSPGPGNAMSPTWSPGGYQSPAYKSPAYGGFQSPIYYPTDHGPTAGQNQQSSILQTSNYSPTGILGGPQTFLSSPVYSGIHSQSSQSPSYSPTSMQKLGESNGYSPNNFNIQSSPRYSPTTPNYNYTPQYSPTSQSIGSGPSPRYQSSSPRYQIGQSGHSSNGATSPGQMATPGEVYHPSSPAYNISAPYDPTGTAQPGYNSSNAQDQIKKE